MQLFNTPLQETLLDVLHATFPISIYTRLYHTLSFEFLDLWKFGTAIETIHVSLFTINS